MTFQQLAYFVALAEVHSFTRAAELTGVAQPTLSRQLKALEDDLGARLIDRGGSTPVLTAAGEAVLPLARRMLADRDSARSAVAELIGLRRGRVRVGATPSLCISMVADVLRIFHEQYPGVHLELTEDGSRTLVRDLTLGTLDVAVLVASAEAQDPTLVLTPFLRERLSVASARSAPALSRRGSISVPQLAKAPMVMFRQGYDLRETTLAAFRAANVDPTFAVEGGEMDAVLRLVEAGAGVAVVPDLVFAGHPGLRRTTLNPALYRTVALAHRADLTPTHAVRQFGATLLSFAHEMSTAGDGTDIQIVHR